MTLTLQILSSGAQPGRETAFPLIGGALTIGRSETNNVVLPDPTREISSSHAVVQERAGDYVIVDTSTNGTFLNGETEPLGDFPTPLNDGDVLRIGSYEMQVVIAKAAAAADPFAGLPPPLGEEPIVEDTAPTLDTLAEVGSLDNDGGDFLDDLLGEAPPNAMNMKTPELSDDPDNTIDDFLDVAPNPDREGGASVPDHSGPGHDFFQSNSTAPAIPDNWEDDLLGAKPEPMGGPPNASAPSSPAPAGGGLIPETTFSSEPFSIPDPKAGAGEPETVEPSGGPDPIDELLGGPLEPAPEPAPDAPPVARPEPKAQVEPQPAPPPDPAPVVVPDAAAGLVSGSDAALARQFLSAAGVDHSRIDDSELGPIME
ncbi:MAG: FHA domain-containing protein, partial [Rhodobacteraceae bacterium]|nr:FHA domain-containing protein [Paracoccaceae bacterium]